MAVQQFTPYRVVRDGACKVRAFKAANIKSVDCYELLKRL